jgi:small subunit ribosomal protein S5
MDKEIAETVTQESATEVATEATETAAPTTAALVADAARPTGNRGSFRGRSNGPQRVGQGGRPGGRGRERAPRERSEFDNVTIDVRRVARVMAGGRRFSFSVTVVIGDRKGRVGVGLGKGADTQLAIEKAQRAAKKAMITVPLTKDGSIRHDIHATFGSSTVEMVPSPGRGLVAGSAMRTVLEYAGVSNVVGKIQTRTKNKLTIARATVDALKTLQSK